MTTLGALLVGLVLLVLILGVLAWMQRRPPRGPEQPRTVADLVRMRAGQWVPVAPQDAAPDTEGAADLDEPVVASVVASSEVLESADPAAVVEPAEVDAPEPAVAVPSWVPRPGDAAVDTPWARAARMAEPWPHWCVTAPEEPDLPADPARPGRVAISAGVRSAPVEPSSSGAHPGPARHGVAKNGRPGAQPATDEAGPAERAPIPSPDLLAVRAADPQLERAVDATAERLACAPADQPAEAPAVRDVQTADPPAVSHAAPAVEVPADERAEAPAVRDVETADPPAVSYTAPAVEVPADPPAEAPAVSHAAPAEAPAVRHVETAPAPPGRPPAERPADSPIEQVAETLDVPQAGQAPPPRDGRAEVRPPAPTNGHGPAPRMAGRVRRSPSATAAEQAAADLALLRTFGVSGPVAVEPDVELEGCAPADDEPAPGTAQPVALRVLGRDGRGIAGATITLLDDHGRETASTRTDPEGHGVLTARRPGGYLLVIAAEGYQPGAITVAVADEPVDAEIPLTRSASITGTVGGEDGPIAGAQLALVQDGEIVDSAQSTADGSYRFADLAGGEYGLSVTAHECEPAVLVLELADEAELRQDVDLVPAGLPADDVMTA